ncbi:MAG TPA: EamA family transporter [Segeticoccus sp.]|uniref:DMT family transporter n=1 Tax=Segeticoccus sp. TaxID=2706531 RepID=UPI002D80A23C|nr:EamA family transporter [Segeticoccus sp.]HET8600826.1 EamA family transporter [Segeticoccus sp.]
MTTTVPTRSAPPPLAATRVPWQAKFLALAAIWGSSFLLIKFGLRGLEPLQVAALRVFSGAAVLTAVLLIGRGHLPRGARTWGHLAVTGFFACTLPWTLFAVAEERVSSALAGIGNAVTPIAAVLVTLALLPAEKVPARKVVGVLIGFLGVLVIMEPWASSSRPDLLGFGMTLAAGASYGVGWTWTKRYLTGGELQGLSAPAGQLLTASAEVLLVLLGWWIWQGGGSVAAPWSVTGSGSTLWAALAAVLALGVVGTGLAMSMQYDVVRVAGPTVATSVTYLIPVVSVALGMVVLHERLGPEQVVGAVVVLAAAALIGMPARRRHA